MSSIPNMMAEAAVKSETNAKCEHVWVDYQPLRGEPYRCCSKAGCGITHADWLKLKYPNYYYTYEPEVAAKPMTYEQLDKVIKDVSRNGMPKVTPKPEAKEEASRPKTWNDLTPVNLYADDDTQLLIPGFDPPDVTDRFKVVAGDYLSIEYNNGYMNNFIAPQTTELSLKLLKALTVNGKRIK